MKRRVAALLGLAVAVTFPVFARVISYAPYTSQTARVGIHERTTRHFVLIEGKADAFNIDEQLVLYDSSGAEEPRVVYPKGGGTTRISHAALYERKGSSAPPYLLLTDDGDSNEPGVKFSPDGGENWLYLQTAPRWFLGAADSDVGGPFVQGLTNQILPGTDEWPFILASDTGVHAVSATGTMKVLSFGGRLVGRNAAGTQFLLRSTHQIRLFNLDGTSTFLTEADPIAVYSGWITPDGAAYIQMLRPEGRFLFLHRYGLPEFVMGPYDRTPPEIGAPPVSVETMRFFAAPSHDFSGAWMIQRQAGKPTTLWRHTPARGTEKMWEDVAGPEVEALIAGASGETLLVQVHRERDGVEFTSRPIDPALAVWRIGDPAPRGYDELYLREEWNKGFVHVDVDRLAAGEPFVFNSGFRQRSPIEDVISPPVSGGGGDVTQEWGVVRGSLKQRLVLPGVARLEGAFESRWLTDVTIYNPQPEPQNVEVLYVGIGEESQASGGRTKTITLGAKEIRLIPDVLKTLFDMENGGGALHFAPAEAVTVTARTYSRRSDGGTFGYGMLAIDFFNAAGPRFPLTFAGAFPGEHFRTNLLLTDTSGRGTSANIQAVGVLGLMGASDFTFGASANGIAQFNGLGSSLALLPRDFGGLVVQPTRGTIIPTVVAIDNRTNDATYFPPDLPAIEERTIPVIGHVDGVYNSHFRSDLYLLNPTQQTRTVILEARMWDSRLARNVQFTLLPREARVIPDALQTLFGLTGLAILRYDTVEFGEGVRVTSRTYTREENGATYGTLIPPLNGFQLATPGERLEIMGVNASDDFRANLGLVDLTPLWFSSGNASVRISILDQASQTIDSFVVQVPASGGMQVNDIFRARGITPPPASLIVLDILNGGVIGAYATLTDNKTNDSLYLGAQLGAQPN